MAMLCVQSLIIFPLGRHFQKKKLKKFEIDNSSIILVGSMAIRDYDMKVKSFIICSMYVSKRNFDFSSI